ncbi:AsmA family protein [Cohaesibacter celericrescens]|uniref:AsmA domain-containing protein n=1 Tax=Cohaesibacter celericrescens TaxID=2067669 RepID=A0A2N5XTM4_9HYPH|nr:AsmA family protein [Cohaesibacter celericrescens]PLW77853.1 hypothetical protein C0081_07655 [Cohaesibacter celericrescens]
MRNILISLLSTLFLVILALAFVPFFVSTDFLKTQVEQFVKDQSDMTLDINGDVSLSLLTGLKLSAETVSLRDQQDKPLFAIDQLDFSLALSPLLSGKADITGITLNRPVLTLTSGSNSSTTETGAVADTTTADTPSDAAQSVDLSALKIRRLTINDAELISQDEGGHDLTLLSGLDFTIAIPDFNGPADISGTLPYKDQDHDFTGTLANAGNAINGQPTLLDLDISSDLIKAKLQGELALKSSQIFVANYAANAGNVTQLFAWLGITPSPLSVGKLGLTGSVVVSGNAIDLPGLSLSLDDQTLQAAARIFTGPTMERPLVRLALDTSTLNLDKILPFDQVSQSQPSAPEASETAQNANQQQVDLAPLSSFDLTMDIRAGRLTYRGEAIRQLKFLAHLLDGKLQANLKSANVAKGNLQASLSGNISQLIWNGSFNARQLDINEIARLAGQNSPLTGTLTTDINFAAQGLQADQIVKNGNLAGVIALKNGQFTHSALQVAIPNQESASLRNITSTITISGLEAPADIKGGFSWNDETIRYASTVGLSEAFKGAPIPASLSLDARPVSIGLSGRIDPANASLSDSQLSLKTTSSKALLAWLGQEVSSGTPNVPMSLSTRLAFAPQKTSLNGLSLQMGQSRGSGDITYSTASSAKPTLNGKLAFETLDVTPFMGDGAAQGRTASKASTANAKTSTNGWDTTPIDFSGLNTLNADLAFSANSLVARDIATGPVSLQTKLQNGQLTTSLDQLSLYDGQGTGGFTVNAQSSPAKIGANFALSGMQMAQFLSDSIDLKSLSGTGGVSINLTTTGNNQAQLIGALDGTGKLEVKNGQIKGINIPQMLRTLKGNILEGWASTGSQSTDFSALTASFAFDKGIVSNSDLLMLSPLLRLTGAGNIDLPNKRIDYKTTPKLISKLKGQGGLVDADGIPIPIIIKGKLDKPRIYPDIPGILENPQAILQGLGELGGTGKAASESIQKVKKTVTKELQKQSEKLGINLNNLLQPQSSNTQTDPDQQETEQKQPALEEQLFRNVTKGLFGN